MILNFVQLCSSFWPPSPVWKFHLIKVTKPIYLLSVLLRDFLDQNWTGWLPKGYQREILSKNLARWDLSEGGGVCLWDGTIDKLSRKYHLQWKEIRVCSKTFFREIYGATYGNLGWGRVGGWKVRNNGHDGEGGILILEQDFIGGRGLGNIFVPLTNHSLFIFRTSILTFYH